MSCVQDSDEIRGGVWRGAERECECRCEEVGDQPRAVDQESGDEEEREGDLSERVEVKEFSRCVGANLDGIERTDDEVGDCKGGQGDKGDDAGGPAERCLRESGLEDDGVDDASDGGA